MTIDYIYLKIRLLHSTFQLSSVATGAPYTFGYGVSSAGLHRKNEVVRRSSWQGKCGIWKDLVACRKYFSILFFNHQQVFKTLSGLTQTFIYKYPKPERKPKRKICFIVYNISQWTGTKEAVSYVLTTTPS